MSNPKKKVVVTTRSEKKEESKSKRKVAQRASRGGSQHTGKDELIFGKKNYILMGAGVLLIALGLLLMSGGSMPSPDVWDDSIIYSSRRTVLAPIVILTGLVVEIFAIFK